MGILLNGSINFDNVIWRTISIMVVIVTYGWYFKAISKYMDKRKYATKRINAVVADRKKSGLIYYVYTFIGLDEYAGVTFYDKSLKIMEQYKKGSTVSLYVNPENLGQFWVEKATEPDKKMIFGIAVVILIGLMAIESVFKVPK